LKGDNNISVSQTTGYG